MMGVLTKTPAYRRLVGTMAFNQAGYAMASVVVPLLIFDISGNATLAGSVVALGTGSLILLSLFSCVLTDKFHASIVLKRVTFAQTVLWIGIAIMLTYHAPPLPLIIPCIILALALTAFDAPSEQSLIKQLVSADEVGTANAIAHGRESAAEVLGGPSAGFLYSLNPHLAVFIQGAFHAFAWLLVPQKHGPTPHNNEIKISLWKDIADGFRFVFSHSELRIVTLVAAIANIPMSAFILILILSYRAAGESALIIGMISAAFGIGVTVGSFFASTLSKSVPLGKLGAIALLSFTVSLFALTFLHDNVVATIISLFIAGLPLASFNTAIGSFTAVITPEHQMGAVTTASTIPGIVLMPFGTFLAGFGFDHWGPSTTLALISVFALAATALTVTTRFRTIPPLSRLSEADPPTI